jgi:colanic acid/amylovoran biosynthesis protein
MTRVCLLGASLDVGNRGVLALAMSLLGLVSLAAPGAAIALHYSHNTGGRRRVVIGGASLDIAVMNCRKSPTSSPDQHIAVILALAMLYRCGLRAPARRNPWLRSLLEADFVGDITGGDSFSDIYGLSRFLQGSLPLVSVALLGRPYTMLPQTYGPFRLRTARALARWLLRRAETVFTRDLNCRALVAELAGREARFCPDVAFTLDAASPSSFRTEPAGFEFDSGALVIGANVSGLLYMGGYTGRNMFGLRGSYRDVIDRIVERVLAGTTHKLLLVPHVFGHEEQEEAASAAIAEAAATRHPGRVFAVQGPLNERELKWIIGRTDFFFGSRMHACIAALSQGVPAVGLAYSDKFLGVFQSAGVGDAIVDLRSTDDETVVARTIGALENRRELKALLKARIPAIQLQVRETFRHMIQPATGDRAHAASRT